jgi:hypothetical protein
VPAQTTFEELSPPVAKASVNDLIMFRTIDPLASNFDFFAKVSGLSGWKA